MPALTRTIATHVYATSEDDVLVVADLQGPGMQGSSVLFASDEEDRWDERGGFQGVHTVRGRGANWLALAEDSLFESVDRGRTWQRAVVPDLAEDGSSYARFNDVGIDAAGDAWLCSQRCVWTRHDGRWTATTSPVEDAFVDRLAGAVGALVGFWPARSRLRGFRLHLGEEPGDVVLATFPTGALRLRDGRWLAMTQGLSRPMGVRGYRPKDRAFLEIARRGEAIVGATHTGFYSWSTQQDAWHRRDRVFAERNVDARAPAWVADLQRLGSTLVCAIVPSPWNAHEWLVAGGSGIVAVSEEGVRWAWRVSKHDPAGLISSMAVAKGAVWVGFQRATPEASVLLLTATESRFVGLAEG